MRVFFQQPKEGAIRRISHCVIEKWLTPLSRQLAAWYIQWLVQLSLFLNDYGSILAAGRNFWRVVGQVVGLWIRLQVVGQVRLGYVCFCLVWLNTLRHGSFRRCRLCLVAKIKHALETARQYRHRQCCQMTPDKPVPLDLARETRMPVHAPHDRSPLR